MRELEHYKLVFTNAALMTAVGLHGRLQCCITKERGGGGLKKRGRRERGERESGGRRWRERQGEGERETDRDRETETKTEKSRQTGNEPLTTCSLRL